MNGEVDWMTAFGVMKSALHMLAGREVDRELLRQADIRRAETINEIRVSRGLSELPDLRMPDFPPPPSSQASRPARLVSLMSPVSPVYAAVTAKPLPSSNPDVVMLEPPAGPVELSINRAFSVDNPCPKCSFPSDDGHLFRAGRCGFRAVRVGACRWWPWWPLGKVTRMLRWCPACRLKWLED